MKVLLTFTILLMFITGCSNKNSSKVQNNIQSSNFNLTNILTFLGSEMENIREIGYVGDFYTVMLKKDKFDDFLNIINVEFEATDNKISEIFGNNKNYCKYYIYFEDIYIWNIYSSGNKLCIAYRQERYVSKTNVSENILINLFDFSLE